MQLINLASSLFSLTGLVKNTAEINFIYKLVGVTGFTPRIPALRPAGQPAAVQFRS